MNIKSILCILALASLLTSCGGSKKIASTTAVTAPEDKVIIADPHATTPEVDTEIIETPELPDETNQMPPEEIVEVEEPNLDDIVVTDIPIEFVDHSNFDDLLKKYVSASGNVDYNGIKKEWRMLRDYIQTLGENMPSDRWSENNKLAYWMNAYNAMTIDLILRNYPLASIKDIKDPWDQRLWKLGDKWYNLNQIEHQILRKMGDARIHFGINCASFSCPPLLNEAFTARQVDGQLDTLARQFVNDTKRNTISANSIEVSKIFTWFAKDFKTEGSLIDFLNKYSNTPISTKAKKRYKDYNWTLNE